MNPPNILLLLTDDHAAWALHHAGNHELHTPHLDALAQRGCRFENAFTPTPVCSPARATLLTGLMPSQHGIHCWIQEHGPFAEQHGTRERDWLGSTPTLATELARDGYRCALAGKWHCGRSLHRPPGYHMHCTVESGGSTHNHGLTYSIDGQAFGADGNRSRFIADAALQQLDQLAGGAGRRPFFLHVGLIATHSPYHEREHDPRWVEHYRNARFDDLPPYTPHPWRKNEAFTNDAVADPNEVAACRRGYYAAVSEVDEQVGRILCELDRRGLRDSTLIVYTSDHGCALGHNGFWGKGNSTRPLNMYDVSLRVPLIVAGPGIARGAVINETATHLDTFATLLEAAGGSVAELSERTGLNHPGATFLPMLADLPSSATDTIEWSNTVFGEYGDLRMIRTPSYKLVRRYPDGPDDLFDLMADPAEEVNLASQPEHRNLRERLLVQMERWFAAHQTEAHTGLNVKQGPCHNVDEAWRDGRREARGLQVY